MDSKIYLSKFLTEALGGVSEPLTAAAECGSETCSGQGCTVCEGGACETAGCMSCQCAYETAQCVDGQCSQSCNESCGEEVDPCSFFVQTCTQFCEIIGQESCDIVCQDMCEYCEDAIEGCKTLCETTYETSTVTPWSWSVSNGSASDAQTQTAYYALDGGVTTDFSYLVWNDIVDKVNEIIEVLGGMWDDSYASLNATKMTYSNKEMTAVRFNSVRYNMSIFHAVPSSIPLVSKGDIIYGSYFLEIASEINSWISNL